jgi:hypothetical protein
VSARNLNVIRDRQPRVFVGGRPPVDLGGNPAAVLPTQAEVRRPGSTRRRRLATRVVLVAVLAMATGVGLHIARPIASQGVEWAWTHVGPDYSHTPAERAAARVCLVGTPAYDLDRCQTYTESTAAGGLDRFPVEDGGTCRLHSRFGCARLNHLEQWDQDVPGWAPWWLHNGVPGLIASGLLGVLAGLACLVAAGVAGAGWRMRRWVTWPAVGALVGAVVMDVVRHQDDPIPPPVRYVLLAVVLVVGVLAFPLHRIGGDPR